MIGSIHGVFAEFTEFVDDSDMSTRKHRSRHQERRLTTPSYPLFNTKVPSQRGILRHASKVHSQTSLGNMSFL